jgi:sugar phosphate isomerase/epimerase
VSAREPLTRDILASHWAIAGDSYPGAPSEVSPFAIEERVAVAAATGYTGIGLLHADLLAIEQAAGGLAPLDAALRDAGLRHVEVECLIDWFADGEARAASDRRRADLLRAAAALGARHVKVNGELTGRRLPLAHLAHELAELAREAAEAGTTIAVEPMPFSGIPDIAAGLQLLEAAGAPNARLLVDVWHVARAGTPYAELAAVPGELIAHVELDDALAEPVGDLWTDTVHHRLLPGEGELDVTGFLAAIRATGYAGPVGVEVISERHRRLPLREAAEAAYRSTVSALEAEAAAAALR